MTGSGIWDDGDDDDEGGAGGEDVDDDDDSAVNAGAAGTLWLSARSTLILISLGSGPIADFEGSTAEYGTSGARLMVVGAAECTMDVAATPGRPAHGYDDAASGPY